MRIRNRALSFSALSCSSKSDLSTIPETKNQHEQAGKVHQHEEEEEKVHLNSDSKPQHQSYYSEYSLPPANESRSPSKEEDQLRQVEDRVYEHGCKNYIDGSSCLIPDQEDCATKEEGEKEETWSANHKRSKNSGAQIAGLHLSSQAGASWGEGENAFPLKKRKRKYEFMIVSPMEKKQEDLSISNRVINVKKVKNNNSKSSLLEGSRCSRVNGRGWRCCQATLVGYSLCEHHLGKGRLKSINNTLRNSSASATMSCSKKRKALSKKKNEKQFLLGKKIQDEEEDEDEDEDDEDDDDDDGGEGKEEKKKKKKKAGGVVKARSMSSLLGQMSHG